MNAGTLQRARKTPHTMISETVIGEMSGLTSLMGASAPPSQAPAANPQKMPSACRLRRRLRRLAFAPPITLETAAFPGWRSTEFVQKHESAQKNAEGNPEMHVSGNGANETTEARSGHCSLEVEFESGPS